MALTSVAKGTSRKESLLQEILIQINNKKEGLLKELKLLNEIEAELKKHNALYRIANEPQPLVNPPKEGARIETKSYKLSYGPVNDRKKTEITLKCYKDGDKEEFLQFLLDFKRHAPRLGWDTSVLLFENLEALLQGAALTQWQVASFGLDVNEPDSFEEALDNWKRRKNLNYDAMRDQLEYMRRARKPREYTPEEFIQRLQHVNLMIPQFIDATQDNMLTDDEIKEIAYRGMPSEWRKNFANSGKKVYSESLEAIESYMSTQSDQNEDNDAHFIDTAEDSDSSFMSQDLFQCEMELEPEYYQDSFSYVHRPMGSSTNP
eukprot:CAMPEP_0172416566 /NCGR_PEP_ID=MMETSP1064-20121228/3087_1 /TAXON_ID=202472 /ORGANISM="Aulacoseira subarctica , Strain CCAP 1002/5" /LENGTH=318 /DNA_ID=CAMNT_0013154355 /DNA_START=79 /DNA_END=1030 /DNA_ORIENTATION=-